MEKRHEDALGNIFFPVRKVKATDFTKKLQFTNHRSHFIVVSTPEGDLVVNSCSPDYELISNRDLITPVVEKLSATFDIEIKAKHNNYSKFFVDFIMKDHQHKVLKKDMIIPRIRLNNSYDGNLRYSYDFGFYRVVCSNGLSIPEGNVRTTKMMHTPAAGNNAALDKTLQAIEEFVEESKTYLSGYDPLIARKFSGIAAAQQRILDIVENTDFPKKQAEAATERLEKEAAMGYQINDFLVYNALNYALHNNESKMQEHKKSRADLAILNYMIENPE